AIGEILRGPPGDLATFQRHNLLPITSRVGKLRGVREARQGSGRSGGRSKAAPALLCPSGLNQCRSLLFNMNSAIRVSRCAMSIIGWIILGLISGFIASKIVNKSGEGFFLDIVLGIVGAIVGGFIFTAVGAS